MLTICHRTNCSFKKSPTKPNRTKEKSDEAAMLAHVRYSMSLLVYTRCMKLYVAGKISKNSVFGTHDWRDAFCVNLNRAQLMLLLH